MRLGTVVGTVTATVKDGSLTGRSMLVLDLVDAGGSVIEHHVVATDTCGAGIGDTVLVTSGSAARQAAGASGVPSDLAIVAVVEEVSVPGS
jgi:microcompartment protein CcmK/EutM